jgi:hypothetical protein
MNETAFIWRFINKSSQKRIIKNPDMMCQDGIDPAFGGTADGGTRGSIPLARGE